MTRDAPRSDSVLVRQTRPSDFDSIIRLSAQIYAGAVPWSREQLESHGTVFPEGQLVAVDPTNEAVVGMAASLIIFWDDYEPQGTWRDFTAAGTFQNHDPARGRTLYGAEVIVAPSMQGQGVGTRLYAARRALAERRGLLRIRAGARLRGYGAVANSMWVVDYVLAVVRGELHDATLSFQLKRGFHVIDVVGGYLRHDPESRGFAATIEWLNPAVATREDYGTAIPLFAPYVPHWREG
jgi:ribosomal protein S18 acetylase RimI-like enzyme